MLIGICGQRKSGRSTVSTMICEMNPSFKLASFTDFREMCFKSPHDPVLDFLWNYEDLVMDNLQTVEELSSILKYKGTILKIECDKNVRIYRGFRYVPLIDEHYLEREMDLSSYTISKLGGQVIWNNTTMENLRSQVTKVMLSLTISKI